MRRFLILVLAANLLLAAGGATATTATATTTSHHHHTWEWRIRTLRFESSDGQPGYSYREEIKTLWWASQRYHPIGGFRTAMCIGHRESGVNLEPRANNPASSAYGVFQIVDGTWSSWYRNYPKAVSHYHLGYDRGNPRNNIILSMRAMHDSLLPWGGWC
jgi:hypothetical protein